MALPPQPDPAPTVEDSFVADRKLFWDRFTGLTKFAVIAIVTLLILMWIFIA